MTDERKAQENAADALLAARTALEQERKARSAAERLAAEMMDKLAALVGEQARARSATECLAAETMDKLVVLLGEQMRALAMESERRAAAEARAVKAEQARDGWAAENAEALRMFEAHKEKVEEDRKAEAEHTETIRELRRQIAADRERAASAAQIAERPPPKGEKRLPKT